MLNEGLVNIFMGEFGYIHMMNAVSIIILMVGIFTVVHYIKKLHKSINDMKREIKSDLIQINHRL